MIVVAIVAGRAEARAVANTTAGGPYVVEASTAGATAVAAFSLTNAQMGPQGGVMCSGSGRSSIRTAASC